MVPDLSGSCGSRITLKRAGCTVCQGHRRIGQKCYNLAEVPLFRVRLWHARCPGWSVIRQIRYNPANREEFCGPSGTSAIFISQAWDTWIFWINLQYEP